MFPLQSAAQQDTNACPSLAKPQLGTFRCYQMNFLLDSIPLYIFFIRPRHDAMYLMFETKSMGNKYLALKRIIEQTNGRISFERDFGGL